MRLAKSILFLSVLSTVAMAQMPSGVTAGTAPSQYPSGSTPQDPAQPPPEESKPKTSSTFDPQETAGETENRLLGEVKLMNRYTQLNGDKTRSFRVEGSNNLAEFNLFTDYAVGATSFRMQTLFMYRGTDDSSIDPEHNSIQRGYLRLFNPKTELILGDSLVNLSRLAFNQNIKGVSFTQRINDDWKVMAAAGIFIDRWGSLYLDLPGRPFVGALVGGRIERWIYNRESSIGLNFSRSSDVIDSRPPALVGTAPQPADNFVVSLDKRLQFRNGFRFEGEYAYSWTDFDTRSAITCILPCNTSAPQPSLERSQGDYGVRLEGSYRYKRVSLRSSYLRFQPNFAAMNARQIPDLQDFVFRVSYDLNDWLTADGAVRRSNNDLRNQLLTQRTIWGPEIKFIFHDLEFYKRAVFEVGYRHRNISTGNNSEGRGVRIPYVEATLPVKRAIFTLGYERRDTDDLMLSLDSNVDRYYAGLRGVFDIGNWGISPNFRYELERQTHQPRIQLVPSDPKVDHDSNRLASVSLFIEAPKYFLMEGAFRSSSATIFGPNGYSRPSYRAAITHKIRNDENTIFTFGFERYSNFYFTTPNYDERVWSGTLVYRFGRRGQ